MTPITAVFKRVDCWVLLLMALAFLIRITALYSLKDSIYHDYLLWDERLYHNWAKKIASGSFDSTSVYAFSPLPAYLMAALYTVFSADILWVRIFNLCCGVATCFLIYRIAENLAGRKTALVALALAALYEPFILYSTVPLKTALSIFLCAWAVYLLLLCANRCHWLRIVGLGAVVGLMLNVRSNYIVLLPLFLLFVLWWQYRNKSSPKRLALCLLCYTAGLSVTTSPFMARNYLVAGELALSSSQMGKELFLGNNLTNKDPWYRPVAFASSSPTQQVIHFRIEASRRAGRVLSPRESSEFWTREVLQIALEKPLELTTKLLQKTLVFFNRADMGDHYHIGFLQHYVTFYQLPLPGLWLLFPLGLTGLLLQLWQCKKTTAMAAVFALYGFTLILFFCNTRYRVPMLVILIPGAAWTLVRTGELFYQRRFAKLMLPASVIAGFAFLGSLPVRGAGDMSAYYNTHAIVLQSRARPVEALDFWQGSVDTNGAFSVYGNLALAGYGLRVGDQATVKHYLAGISDRSFAVAGKYDLLGDLYRQQQTPGEAIRAYQRSLLINPGQLVVRLKLIQLLEGIDGEKMREQKEKLEYIRSFYY